MGADDRIKNLTGTGRRDFLRWSTAAAITLGLSRTRYLDVLSDVGGSALADSACAKTQRSIHFVAGAGGLAWFTLLFPQNVVAKGTNANYAFHAMGKAVKATATDNELYYAPESPFQKLGKRYQISAFMAGTAENHTSTPTSAATPSATASLMAAIGAIQGADPTLIPTIAINPFAYGAAPGAPMPAAVGNAAGLVELFNSAASKTLLAQPSDAALHEAFYKAFLGLNRGAGRPTVANGYQNGKVAASLLGKNLSDQLRPTTADEAAYGLDAGTPTNVLEIGHAVITALKAFRLGLTSSIVIPAMRDDPHTAFSGGDASAQPTVARLGKIFDAMMADAAASSDPACSGKSLADSLVFTIHGDTPKTCLDRNGWSDTTPSNHNVLYVFGNGYLKTGWHGGVNADGSTSGWDPETGNAVASQPSSTTSTNAATAALYAVAKGDLRRVQDFSRATITGVVNPPLT